MKPITTVDLIHVQSSLLSTVYLINSIYTIGNMRVWLAKHTFNNFDI